MSGSRSEQDTPASNVANSAAIAALKSARQKIVDQLSQVIVGQQHVIDELLIALFSRGHCLLEGVPGLAKTLMISTLARTLNLTFSRIQFTPDLMPADITGTEIIEENKTTGARERRFLEGPVFSHVLLADEINRTPPKTQAALLEAMQERQVTVGRVRHPLTDPFFVLATQNPIEQEGTYPLPEAQLDRFMCSIHLDYPDFAEEVQVVRTTTTGIKTELSKQMGGEEILFFQQLIRRIPITDHVLEYAVRLASQTRPGRVGTPDKVNQFISWGAGPRASQYLVLGAKAHAAMRGKYAPDVEDVQAVALPVLRHRVFKNYKAEAEGVTTEQIITGLL